MVQIVSMVNLVLNIRTKTIVSIPKLDLVYGFQTNVLTILNVMMQN